MDTIIQEVLALSPGVRYCALYSKGKLTSQEKSSLRAASSAESDKYEELIVNPTLLKLVTQRGNIDCGGAQYVLIRYGNFFELVHPLNDGHISVGLESTANPLEIVGTVEQLLARRKLL